MNRRVLCLLVLGLSCLMTSACTIGPRVETRYVILKTGQPGKVIENVTVDMSSLNGDEVGEQDIGGWVCMPPEHWNAIVQTLTELQRGRGPIDRLPGGVD